jgi:hypothetical protein
MMSSAALPKVALRSQRLRYFSGDVLGLENEEWAATDRPNAPPNVYRPTANLGSCFLGRPIDLSQKAARDSAVD